MTGPGARSHVTTHVLDATTGRPAAGVAVRLEHLPDLDGPGVVLATATTDADGRVARLGPDELPAGSYRLTVRTGEHYRAQGVTTFYPLVQVTFTLEPGSPGPHVHVPVLLSPFSYTTYRGS